jgi:hypothetical protein
MARAVVETDITSGRLVALPRPGRRVEQVFNAARRRGPYTPAQQAFWEHVVGLAQAQ